MSTSARRLGTTVATTAWPHQSQEASASGVVPLFASDQETSATPRDLNLPSVSGQKLMAAEQEAHARGFEEGTRAATEAAGTQAVTLAGQLTRALEEVATLRNEALHQTERELVRLAISMTERVVGQRIEDDRPMLVTMARKAIESAGKPAEATVCLHPSDYELATRNGAETGGDGISIVADQAVPLGGCIVQSPFGVIDVGLSTQVKEMSRILLGEEPPVGPSSPADNQSPESVADDADR